MGQIEIGVKFLMGTAWNKHSEKQIDSALMMYRKAFETMKESAIRSNLSELSGQIDVQNEVYDALPSYNRLTESQVRLGSQAGIIFTYRD